MQVFSAEIIYMSVKVYGIFFLYIHVFEKVYTIALSLSLLLCCSFLVIGLEIENDKLYELELVNVCVL